VGFFVPTQQQRKENIHMAIKLIAAYSKKVGLPGYSSHSFAVSIETELANVLNVAGQTQDLYAMLQQSVDKEIQNAGFVPPHGFGIESTDQWSCSDKQRKLISQIIEDNKLNEQEVDSLANERFGIGLKKLNKLQASGLIDELLAKHSNQKGGNGNGNRSRFNRGDYGKVNT
jgi:hypothetical protein